MGMAKHDHVRAVTFKPYLQFFGRGERIDDVVDEKFFTFQRDYFRFPKIKAQVGVAQHRGGGRDATQFELDHGGADVTRMEDVLHARKYFFHRRIKKSVCI